MDMSGYGPNVNPLAAALANAGPAPSAVGSGTPGLSGGSMSTGMPGGGASGVPSIPGLPPGVMPMGNTTPQAPIASTGVAQLPGGISPGGISPPPQSTGVSNINPSLGPAVGAPVLPPQATRGAPFGFGSLGAGGGSMGGGGGY